MFTKAFEKTAGIFASAAKLFKRQSTLGTKMTQNAAAAVKPNLARNQAEFSMRPSKFARAPGSPASEGLAKAQIQAGTKRYSEV